MSHWNYRDVHSAHNTTEERNLTRHHCNHLQQENLSRLSRLTSQGNTRSQLEATNISSQSMTCFQSGLKPIRSECTQHRSSLRFCWTISFRDMECPGSSNQSCSKSFALQWKLRRFVRHHTSLQRMVALNGFTDIELDARKGRRN